VPEAASQEYAFVSPWSAFTTSNTARTSGTEHPISCQTCHYSPALDLAHVGPRGPGNADANGRQQTLNQTFSRVMHNFHGKLTNTDGSLLFPDMPGPRGRTVAVRNAILAKSCYNCHPGAQTECFRG
jgi:hypothetical protein